MSIVPNPYLALLSQFLLCSLFQPDDRLLHLTAARPSPCHAGGVKQPAGGVVGTRHAACVQQPAGRATPRFGTHRHTEVHIEWVPIAKVGKRCGEVGEVLLAEVGDGVALAVGCLSIRGRDVGKGRSQRRGG